MWTEETKYESRFINRFTTESGIDLVIDWCQVVAIQKQNLQVNIHLKNGECLKVQAISYEQVHEYFEVLYGQWQFMLGSL